MAAKKRKTTRTSTWATWHSEFPTSGPMWFRKIKIRQSSTKYDHLLSALPTDICSSINDSLAEIEENAADAYEQLKALLMSRYTMDRWARAFELHKFPEIGDMKPSVMMRQMKALLPPDSNAGTYFMAAFLLRLPADMIDHIISQDFKDCNKRRNMLINCTRGGGATPSPPSMRTTIQPSTPFPAAAARRARHTTAAASRRPARGATARRPPGPYRDDSDICYYHITYGEQARKCKPGCQWVPGNGSAAEN
jgi:hypothetical protein